MGKPQNREYFLQRYHEQRGSLVWLLGGKCHRCGDAGALEFDHIDPKKKSFTISSRLRSYPWDEDHR